MCGIAGIINFSNIQFHQSLIPLKRMTDCMVNRGPDDEGFLLVDGKYNCFPYYGDDTPVGESESNSVPWFPSRPINKGYNVNSKVVLGHRRLSILDLTSYGHQPMCTRDGRYWIVYNGEIYNFSEISVELKKEGVQLLGKSDTEVLINSYAVWGEDCLKRFNGMFAFAIWDNIDRVLFCARDRLGIKPFYYYFSQDFFIFASDIQAIICSELYQPSPNWEGVYHSLSLHCAPRPMTCFKDIFALEQAHYLTIDPFGNINKKRYWHIPLNQSDSRKKEKDWLDEFDNMLKLAVKRRLVADVPIGTFMSGGIDSTTVSAVASELHPGIKAFTLSHKDAPEIDELYQAKATASLYKFQHIVEDVDPLKVLAHLDEIVRCYREPFPSLGPIYLISQLVKNNSTTVVLSGLGPDELFAGYNRHRMLNWWRNLNFVSRRLSKLTSANSRLDRIWGILGSKNIVEYYINCFSSFTANEKKRLFTLQDSSSWDTATCFRDFYDIEDCDFKDDIEAICYFDIINYIGNHHVFRGDLFSMHFSIESRFPFLDHELVEMAFKMPSSIKVKGKESKYILRQLAKKYIHPSCLSMKKKGFIFPMDLWMKTTLKKMINDKIANLKDRGVMTSSMIDSISTRFWENKDSYMKLWLLVSVELWLESFID